MEIVYLSLEQIVSINRKVVSISGDSHGILHEANLWYVVDAIKTRYRGVENTLFWKAAFLLHFFLCNGHIFIEGNKRTGVAIMSSFLEANGFVWKVENDKEAYEFVLQIAQGNVSMNKIFKWIKSNSGKVGI